LITLDCVIFTYVNINNTWFVYVVLFRNLRKKIGVSFGTNPKPQTPYPGSAKPIIGNCKTVA
jgi:hypothetical protein